MKNIKKFIVALSVVLGLAACKENVTFPEVELYTTPVYEITDIALTSGTDSASDVTIYTIYPEVDDIIAWQTSAYTLRMNKIENLWAGNSLVADDTEEENVLLKVVKFDEVYSGTVGTTAVNLRRKFDISVSAEDGVGTMTITEYDNSVAEYSIVLTETEEWQQVE